jgi:hypothetical protein
MKKENFYDEGDVVRTVRNDWIASTVLSIFVHGTHGHLRKGKERRTFATCFCLPAVCDVTLRGGNESIIEESIFPHRQYSTVLRSHP